MSAPSSPEIQKNRPNLAWWIKTTDSLFKLIILIDWLIPRQTALNSTVNKTRQASRTEKWTDEWVCVCREIPRARQLRTDPPKNKRRYLICRHTHHTFSWISTDWQCQRLPAALGNGPEKPMDKWDAHLRITYIYWLWNLLKRVKIYIWTRLLQSLTVREIWTTYN